MHALKTLALMLALVAPASAVTLNGNQFAYRPTGSSSGSSWILSRNGYVGTYVTLSAPGAVTITVNANGTASGGTAPRMNVVVADTTKGFDVTSGNYTATMNLPAGTHFLRTEFTNDLALTAKSLKINSVSVTGANVSNTASNSNALAASDTYIANYRKGPAAVQLGLPAGTPVQVKLKRLDFNWGTVVPGSGTGTTYGVDKYLGTKGEPKQTNYQARLNQNFNSIGAENAGKWNDTEQTQGRPNMTGVDMILNYADAHGMTSRLHTLAYDRDQNDPKWVRDLRNQAVSSSTAKTKLRKAISSRIDYYAPRAARTEAIDVFNESYQSDYDIGKASYMKLFGASGLMNVFNELKGDLGTAKTKLYLNESQALIYSYNGSDGRAAGYPAHVEQMMQAGIDAGYGNLVGGIGTQHYPWAIGMHSPSDMLKAMQTYNVTGLPQTITELGAFSDWGLTADHAATILGDTMRLAFGNPNETGVYLWGFHRENGGSNMFAPGLALYDVNTSNWNNWTLTKAGKVWQDKLGVADWDGNAANAWTTNLTATTDANGAISFSGFYGDYEITAGGKTYQLKLAKGTTSYNLVPLTTSGIPEPGTLVLAVCAGVFLGCRR